ncbi:protein-glutamate O-methyltransferase CheR [Pseudomaricurvus alkylphenolicus]|jgi:chemotaxis protein methyltransferase CheR/type IV pilus assembly protein PilK|uniref:CheR family methyltransferase n=1 Tax=Pseudomaricurvus alkylphenolicus TaxID=1306991 RepID=UPI0014221C74|nr:CheR family methyltransferase [Pseudomaricurvus alkylphenolicus]NIB39616.1 protein-glutamate O-methyltransferase CheR [Pseudomaricurvus alkylphenolicus]
MAWSLKQAPKLTDVQFERWNKLLEERTGIQVSPHQRGFLQIQLAKRMRELKVKHYNQYFDQVASGALGMVEWSILIDRLVVKETSFFRHRDSVELVRQDLQNRINNQVLTESFEVWSLGCATGEEPYSLAMVINDCFELAGLEPYYGITATDISQPALQHARTGIYSARKLQPVATDEQARYFNRLEDGRMQVIDKLRDRVCFSPGNLLKISEVPRVALDIIFCQNVLIYFRRWLRREILNELATRLKPGGILLIGLGEIVDWEHPGLQRVPDDRVQAYIRV